MIHDKVERRAVLALKQVIKASTTGDAALLSTILIITNKEML